MTTICGINEAKFRVFLVVLDHPHCSIAEIDDVLDRDHSTIGKQLKPLHEQKLVTRYPRNISDGGVRYRYVAQPLAEAMEWVQQELSAWTDKVLNQFT
ncbi:hypothetical protein [Haladaptatus halobius]|uniref:hypothetical protein n=1 Tax=Haladaptatus halobius TaxID=2884875 RepID=UPI001D0A95BF|nr:hypothetical protein [Haladaptatus halobius]